MVLELKESVPLTSVEPSKNLHLKQEKKVGLCTGLFLLCGRRDFVTFTYFKKRILGRTGPLIHTHLDSYRKDNRIFFLGSFICEQKFLSLDFSLLF